MLKKNMPLSLTGRDHRIVVKRSGGHQNAIAPHLLDVRHVSGLEAITIGLREFFARWIGTNEDNIVSRGCRLPGRGVLRV